MAVIATGKREDALEIVQDAMLKLAKKYSDKPAEQWGPLFHRILQSTIRDWYRREKVRNGIRQLFFNDENVHVDVMDTYSCKIQPEPDQQLLQDRAMIALDSALNALPLRQQQVFLLRQWEGLNVAATAEAMSCSQGSVKTHLSRATAALREKLKGHQV